MEVELRWFSHSIMAQYGNCRGINQVAHIVLPGYYDVRISYGFIGYLRNIHHLWSQRSYLYQPRHKLHAEYV